ncbi:MAG: carboxypeptidase-like regulatory domain-containing protein, partial [Acidobacteriaceae bacterium]|nr:carboxypeptidase-like regulatory domain-containing protein [Acidobacteriaceae bacterium]
MLFVATRASAQGGDSASITGLATDSSGAVLPGVTVEASSPALIEKTRTVVSDSAGRYAIVDLRPGTYDVTFSLPGFKTFKREGVVLEGAFTAQINGALSVGTLEETVVVTGASPVVDVQNTRTQLVVNQDVLQALPVMRSIQDQANLVPGVVSQSTSAGQILSDFYINSVTARGATDQRISYDGMRNDMMLGTGGQAIAGGVNELGQAEMVYDIGGQSAEFATAGVRMDAIPKDGGNRLSGTYR